MTPTTTPANGNETVADVLVRGLRQLRIATVVLAVALLTVGVVGYRDLKGKADEARRTHAALCALRGDLNQRVTQSENYLDEHPRGAPGIPAAAIRQSLVNARRTARSLRRLDCPPPGMPPRG
jgi:hypothetical protein